jgi:hypothetical protein
MAEVEKIYLDEKQKSEKIQGLWQELLTKREADSIEPKKLSSTDEKTTALKESIPSSIPSAREKSFLDEIATITQIPTEDEGTKKIKGRLNPHLVNIQLAARIDSLYSSRIIGLGKDLKRKLDLQKGLLNLKALLPKDLSAKKVELSPEAKALIDKLNTTYNLNLDKNDLPNLRIQIDSNLDSVKLEVQHGFTDLQTQNHERLLVFHLAQKMRDEKDTFVRNQIAH